MNNPNYNGPELSKISRYVNGHCRTLVDEREKPATATTSLSISVESMQRLKEKEQIK